MFADIWQSYLFCFVGYVTCITGLVIKQILTTAQASSVLESGRPVSPPTPAGREVDELTDPDISSECESDLVRWTRGCVFYSVPHLGATVANYAKIYSFLYPSIEVQELMRGRCNHNLTLLSVTF